MNRCPDSDRLDHSGCHHEQQHQELLWTDIKYTLGHNPCYPRRENHTLEFASTTTRVGSLYSIDEDMHMIGHAGDSFCYDND